MYTICTARQSNVDEARKNQTRLKTSNTPIYELNFNGNPRFKCHEALQNTNNIEQRDGESGEKQKEHSDKVTLNEKSHGIYSTSNIPMAMSENERECGERETKYRNRC